MDFRITAEEQNLLFLIVGHLDEGNAPTVEELTRDTGGDVTREVASLRSKGWILVRRVDDRLTVIGLSPMAVTALSNLRYGRRALPGRRRRTGAAPVAPPLVRCHGRRGGVRVASAAMTCKDSRDVSGSH
ncbi:hypothetical protein [Streptomyces pactum]|uniref:hypothetical protein n=1 Tax=Streptomyces pactum TaxID=68249 RepID=UPI0036F67C19